MSNQYIKEIRNDKELIAIVIKKESIVKENTIQFLTSADEEFQIGMMNRPKNYIIQEHTHLLQSRNTKKTSEFLFIRKGKVQVTIKSGKNLIEKEILEEGDSIVFFGGTHGFAMLEDSEIIEVKQGPYKDKSYDKA